MLASMQRITCACQHAEDNMCMCLPVCLIFSRSCINIKHWAVLVATVKVKAGCSVSNVHALFKIN